MMERTSEQPIAVARKNDEVPLADILSYFIDEVVSAKPGEGRKVLSRPKEVLKYITDLIEWWGDKSVSEVNKSNCRAYWSVCSTLGAARNRLEYLRQAINLAQKDGIIETVVFVHLPEKAQPRDEIFDRSDIARMLKYCLRVGTYTHNETKSQATGYAGETIKTKHRPWRHLMPYFIMAYYTGSRSGAIFTASFVREPGRPWIDLRNGVFHRAKVGHKTAKNKQATSIRIPQRLLQHMRRWRAAGRKYPIEWNGQPITKSKALGKIIKACCPGKKVVAHTYRHTAATMLMQRSELALHDIAGFLGMTMETLDRVYGHHRTHHQIGIDLAMSGRDFGRKPLDPAQSEDDKNAPGDTGINSEEQAKRNAMRMSKNSQKPRKKAA